jgi:hypothetical protein
MCTLAHSVKNVLVARKWWCELEKNGWSAIPNTRSGFRPAADGLVRREAKQNPEGRGEHAIGGKNRHQVVLALVVPRTGRLIRAAEEILMNSVQDLVRLRRSGPVVRPAAEQAFVGLLAHSKGARQNTEERQEQGEMPVLDVDPLHENRYVNQYIATVYI